MKNAVSGLGLAPDAAMVTFPIDMFLPGSDLAPLTARRREFYEGLTNWRSTFAQAAESSPMVNVEGATYEEARPVLRAMADNVLLEIEKTFDFYKATAASEHIDRTLQLIKAEGCKAGLVFNPATPLHYLDHTLDKIDLVLLMSVNPGFGGQSFIPGVMDKIKNMRDIIKKRGLNTLIEVDGGVKLKNAREIASAGADILVMGSAFFNSKDYADLMKKLRDVLKDV